MIRNLLSEKLSQKLMNFQHSQAFWKNLKNSIMDFLLKIYRYPEVPFWSEKGCWGGQTCAKVCFLVGVQSQLDSPRKNRRSNWDWIPNTCKTSSTAFSRRKIHARVYVFSRVIWPTFRMYRANDNPYHAPQFIP